MEKSRLGTSIWRDGRCERKLEIENGNSMSQSDSGLAKTRASTVESEKSSPDCAHDPGFSRPPDMRIIIGLGGNSSACCGTETRC